MKSYLFLIAWVHGSDSSGFEKTHVHKQEDLYKQFKKGNEAIFAVRINIVSGYLRLEKALEAIVQQYGYAAAFDVNYTAHDSTSDLIKVTRHVQKVLDRITPEFLKTVEVHL